ncbi:hypothetical protein GDO81_013566 [Engystomops pustulosus]|uniref:Uncharacterized protein n=1 Tax=Engystomops pustulosus TaxID=76066 RepID=A0AAV7B4M2_ENGPU|nr:hypothetical protein GDO81_013566 [Engystomops pustulosus]
MSLSDIPSRSLTVRSIPAAELYTSDLYHATAGGIFLVKDMIRGCNCRAHLSYRSCWELQTRTVIAFNTSGSGINSSIFRRAIDAGSAEKLLLPLTRQAAYRFL